MSSQLRIRASRLRSKYAAAFRVPLDLVEVHEHPDETADVWCPTRRDLPVWNTGRFE